MYKPPCGGSIHFRTPPLPSWSLAGELLSIFFSFLLRTEGRKIIQGKEKNRRDGWEWERGKDKYLLLFVSSVLSSNIKKGEQF